MSHNVLRNAVVALVLYGAQLEWVLAAEPSAAGATRPGPDTPAAWLAAAKRIQDKSGYELLEQLEIIAASPQFWDEIWSLRNRLAHGQLQFVSRPADRKLISEPMVPSRLQARAYYATLSVLTLLPEEDWDAPTAEAPFQFATDLRKQWHDPASPIEVRGFARRAARGIVALMMKAVSGDLDESTATELLTIYTEGMESLVQLVALDEGIDKRKAAKILEELRLPRLDRKHLDELTRQAADARNVLTETATHLGGKPLQLPPDPSFRVKA